MYNQQVQPQVQNQPTAAYILSLLGGVIGLLSSFAFIGLGAWLSMQIGSYSDYFGTYSAGANFFGLSWTILIGLGVWMLTTSILVIIFAVKLKARPLEHTKWGALILVFSVIGVGGLLGLIGGILALVYRPQPVGVPFGQSAPTYRSQQYTSQPHQPYSQQPITRVCPQCGRVIQENLKYCPNCGKQLN